MRVVVKEIRVRSQKDLLNSKLKQKILEGTGEERNEKKKIKK